MKFKEEVCGNCGLDLTVAEPGRVREMPAPGGDGVEMVFLGECPQCHTNRIMVEPEPEPEPEPEAPSEPEASSEPVVEPEAEPEPAPGTAEPEPEA